MKIIYKHFLIYLLLMEEIINPIRNEKKFFSLLSDKNRYYQINFEINSNSSINIIAIDNNHEREYYEYCSLDVLRNIKYLSLLDTIDDIFEEIKDKIEKKEPKLYEESNILKLVIETGHTKFRQIIFDLKEKEKNINNNFNELYIIIKELREKEITQDQKIKILEKKINKLENNNNELYHKNRQLENSIDVIKTKLNKFNNNYLQRKNRKYRYKYFRTFRPEKKSTNVKKEYIYTSPYKEYNNKNSDNNIFLNLNKIDNDLYKNEEEQFIEINEIKKNGLVDKNKEENNNIIKSHKGTKLALLLDEIEEFKKKEKPEKKDKKKEDKKKEDKKKEDKKKEDKKKRK